ncbi:YhdP family protein [Thioflexithrix psekupsensis]|uniref:YhdP central domain-containing protein n=1 Tax=Thioflexithrix psekupsensis TaxID=1570016 RepID=A0A251X887_9GAMM|nr:DUF3971 domain-containing protein [Thioflexithrix psekupsensis]OUD13752.1 hypothetical protein TPSD3_05200 [Thioflexithrix psekupsensis]
MIKLLRLIFISILVNGLLVVFLLGLLILTYPYYSPILRDEIEKILSQQLQHPIRFETIHLTFINHHLTLQMREVRFPTPTTQATDLHVKQAQVQIDLLHSLRSKTMQLSKIQLDIQQLTLFQWENHYGVFPFFPSDHASDNPTWLTWLQQQPLELNVDQIHLWSVEQQQGAVIPLFSLHWRATESAKKSRLQPAGFNVYIEPHQVITDAFTVTIPSVPVSSLVTGLNFFAKDQIEDQLLNYLLHTQGHLQQIILSYQSPKDWSLHFDLQQIANQATAQWPALDNLNAHIELNPHHGELQLRHSDVHWQPLALYQETITLKRLNGRFRWQKLNAKDWRISQLHLQTYLDNQYPVLLQGELALIKEKISSQLSLSIPQLPLIQIHRYIPEQAIPHTARWLKSALTGGYLNEIQIDFTGLMEDWFSAEKAGFNAQGKITEGQLHYHPNWPALKNINADIQIQGKTLQVNAQKTDLLQRSHSPYVKAIIPDLSADSPILTVQAHVESDMAEGIDFIRVSPVRKVINPDQDLPKMTGKMGLALDLMIPLDKKQESEVKGEIEFKNVELYDSKLNLQLEQLMGSVKFDSEQLQAQLQGQWAKKAVTVQLISALNDAKAPVKVTLSGQADVAFLERQRQHFAPAFNSLNLSDYLAGEMAWQLHVSIPNRKQRSTHQANTQLQFNSDLKGLAILLPAPFGKNKQEVRHLTIEATLPESFTDSPVLFSLNDNDNLALFLQLDKNKPIKALLQLGSAAINQTISTVQLPVEGWMIHGHLKEFDPMAWYKIVAKFRSGQKDSFSLPALQLDIAIDHVPLTVLHLSPVQLELQHQNHHWQLQIDSTGIKGDINYHPDHTVMAKLKKLHITPFIDQEKQKKEKTIIQLEPAQMPEMEIAIADFIVDQYRFGHLTLKAQHDSPTDLHYHAAIDNDYLTVVARGHWQGEKDQQRSTLILSGISDNMGLGLQQLNVTHPPIADGRLEWLLDLIWPGNPSAFRLNKVVGTLSLLLTEGHLVALNPGTVGRMMSLFDLQALPRRLSMDFRDVFDEGLGFAIIAGDFAILDGYAKTDNLIVQSSAARVLITGKTNFLHKTYQQIATVTPHISNTLPIAGIIAGGLTAGAVTLIVQRLLQEQIDKTIQYHYQITGDWAEPIVERITH